MRAPPTPRAPGSAHGRQPAALEDDAALRLGQPAPHAERLAGLQRELAAHVDHGAAVADLLRARGAPRPGRVALPVRVEEDRAVHAPTRSQPLPLPCVVHGAGEPGNVAHLAIHLVLDPWARADPGDR